MRVAEIMTSEPTVLHPEDRLERAVEEMRLGEIRHLPVVDDHGVLIGILSQRDVAAAGETGTQRVRDVMIDDVKTVSPDAPAHEAAYLILRYAIGSVPVVDERCVLLGIVTQFDFVRVAYQLLGGVVPVDLMELEEREADRV